MTDITARGWHDALDHLYADSWQPELRRYRSTFAFRGVPRADHGLRTGLAKLGDEPSGLGPHLLRNFVKYAEERPDTRHDSVWHWLALAQHHGLPTRLLDRTYSPLVALHFVTKCGSAFDCDGVVWCVNYSAAKPLFPSPLRDALRQEHSDVFTPELLARTIDSPQALRDVSPTPALVFLEPPSLDQRIVTQYALFSFLTHEEADMRDWIANHSELCRRIVIPASAPRCVWGPSRRLPSG